jgi:hypothetical protein
MRIAERPGPTGSAGRRRMERSLAGTLANELITAATIRR